MNRFNDLLTKTPVGSCFWLHSGAIGMDDPETFHHLVESLIGGVRDDCIASEAERESKSGSRRYYRVKITRAI